MRADVYANGEGCMSDLADRPIRRLISSSPPLRFYALAGGCQSGEPSVGIVGILPDGSIALIETSLRILLDVADDFRAVHGDPRDSELVSPTQSEGKT